MNTIESNRVTFQEVVQAATRLSAEGEKVTLDAIRKKLGDRGSYTTISKHLNAWKEGLGVMPEGPLTDPDLPEPLAVLAVSLWTEACALARAELSEAKESLEKERAAMIARAEEAERQLQATITEAGETRAELEEGMAGLLQSNAELQDNLDAAYKEYAADREMCAQQHASEIADYKEKLNKHQSLSQRLRENLESAESELTALTKQKAEEGQRFSGQIVDLSREILDLKSQLHNLSVTLNNDVEREKNRADRAEASLKRFSRRKRLAAKGVLGEGEWL